jgi:FtsP/CotA-like multicopper oxidase with cupredoxin domain
MNRRSFVSSVGAVVANQLAGSMLPAQVKKPSSGPQHKRADHTLRIEPCTIEISPGVSIKTIGYNGQVPGPILRLKKGVPVNIDVLNKSGDADLVHWHGLAIDPLNDGAMEEGSPMIPAGGQHRYSFTPKPAGTRWYHTHNSAGANLSAGSYTGQFGFLLVEGDGDPGHYDQEVFLAVHHWEPSFVPMVEMMQAQSANNPKNPGSDVGYKYATINQHRLGAGEPLRVKQGQRVLMRILNASATENIVIALPGHKFKVLAMDGNPVPTPKEVPVLAIAAAERIDAVVEMNSPGVWVLGSTLEQSRTMGLGVVVEYAGQKGTAVWKDPEDTYWDYTQFGSDKPSPKPDETIRLIFNDIGPSKVDPRFDAWAINKKSWPDIDPIRVTEGKRYRLSFLNASGDQHPMHLHRHSFEVTRVGHQDVSGLMKDVINVMPLQTVNVDFVADNPGDSLLHCHMQLHMDFGFMQLIKYTS